MKIAVVGGGPAGLYFAILMKKRRPAAEITVYERNRADDTFGFGVVFSDATLDNFERYDPPSYRRITQEFAYWDDIAIHFKGAVHRIGGNGFCGCSRRTLLLILQERAQRTRRRAAFSAPTWTTRARSRMRTWSSSPTASTAASASATRAFRATDRSAAEQVRLDGIDEAARRLHLHLPGDRVGPLHRPRLPVRGRALDLGLRDRSGDLPARRPRRHGRGGVGRASWSGSSAAS